MATVQDLRRELVSYSSQTQRDAAEFAHILATGDYVPSTDVVELRETAAAFQRRHEAAEAALAQLDGHAAAVLAGLLHEWAAHPNTALREIAHDYMTTQTLHY
jgi:hypothetical protein